ncbi:MAG: FkbM family methyltransferase [Saprospiraceae bacterium]
MIELIKFAYRAYRFRYKLDSDEINYIIRSLKEDSVVIDLGAHKGGYLYWMQKNIEPKGKVYAFEPQSGLFNYLKKISALKKYKNVIIENMGISSEEGETTLFIPETAKGNSPGARIDFLEDGTNYNELKIKTTTLDKYFFDNKINPDFIKIDVEGHEKQVLLGGINLLKKSKPIVLMECENRHLQEGSVFDVFNVLIDLDYKGYFFENKRLTPIEKFNVEIHQKVTEGEFWAAKDYINNFIFEPISQD